MNTRTVTQRFRLMLLASKIGFRSKPLGVGLHNQCWAGVAAEIAKAKGAKTTAYYGVTFREFKDAIKSNNVCRPERRNIRMFLRTLYFAFFSPTVGDIPQKQTSRTN